MTVPAEYRCPADHPRERYHRTTRGELACRDCKNWRRQQRTRERCSTPLSPLMPNDLLREEVLKAMARDPEFLTYSMIADRAGFIRPKDGRPEESSVRRSLGIAATKEKGVIRYRTKIREDKAVRIAEAIGLDPWEIGL